ncbi:MAG: GntR family transcriptional regulator [Pseudonocardiaceae bacterium]
MPGYREIAAELRAAIERGDYPPGATLPRVVDLATQYGVNETTAQRAITVLRTEGLVAQTRRRGAVVRDRTPVRLPVARYADATSEAGPWEVACAQHGLAGWTEVTSVDEQPADETVARELGLEPGTTVIRRGNRMRIGDQMAQLQETWLPLSLFADTPLAAPEKVTGGIYRGLADAGHPPSVADAVVTGRMPTQAEADELDLDLGSPVLDIRRTARDRGGRVVVHVHIVVSADRVSLAYRQLL